jgi:hypothetical protein
VKETPRDAVAVTGMTMSSAVGFADGYRVEVRGLVGHDWWKWP